MKTHTDLRVARVAGRSRWFVISVAASFVLAACGGTSSSSSNAVRNAVEVAATPVASGLAPQAIGGAGIFFDNGAQVPMTIGSQTSSAETTFFVRIGRDGQLP